MPWPVCFACWLLFGLRDQQLLLACWPATGWLALGRAHELGCLQQLPACCRECWTAPCAPAGAWRTQPGPRAPPGPRAGEPSPRRVRSFSAPAQRRRTSACLAAPLLTCRAAYDRPPLATREQLAASAPRRTSRASPCSGDTCCKRTNRRTNRGRTRKYRIFKLKLLLHQISMNPSEFSIINAQPKKSKDCKMVKYSLRI